MTAVLYSEINILCILLLFFIYIKTESRPYTQMENRIFSWVLLSNCMFFATDVVWVFVDSRSISAGIALNYAVNAAYYLLSAAVSYIWFLYSQQAQRARWMKKKNICGNQRSAYAASGSYGIVLNENRLAFLY